MALAQTLEGFTKVGLMVFSEAPHPPCLNTWPYALILMMALMGLIICKAITDQITQWTWSFVIMIFAIQVYSLLCRISLTGNFLDWVRFNPDWTNPIPRSDHYLSLGLIATIALYLDITIEALSDLASYQR